MREHKVLYHFTTREAAHLIAQKGLRPRGATNPANDHGIGLDSNPAYVYLKTTPVRPWHGFDYEDGALIVIDQSQLDDSLIREDEDAQKFGTGNTLAYEGVIEPDAIEDIQFFHPQLDAVGATKYVRVSEEFRDWP